MNNWHMRLWLIVLCTAVIGCVGQPDRRPEVQIQGELQLQRGTRAYINNDYRTAAAMFRRSLELYQSIDDLEGIAHSRINLIETALAVGNYEAASRQLSELSRLVAQGGLVQYRERLQLLRASLAFQQRRYEEALALLEPLLPEFDDDGRVIGTPSEEALSAMASRARIASEYSQTEARLWMARLSNALKSEIFKERPAIEALLERLKARMAVEDGRLDTATEHLARALDAYKLAADRRGIAATLQAQARLRMQQEKWDDAEGLLRRALSVRSWMLDRAGTVAVLGDLVTVNERLGNTEAATELRDWHQRLSAESFAEWSALPVSR